VGRVRQRGGKPNLGVGEGRGPLDRVLPWQCGLAEGAHRWYLKPEVRAAGSGSVGHQCDGVVLTEVVA
jgi:hypothetical protein